LGATYVAVIGGSELESGTCQVKKMADGSVANVAFENIYDYITKNN
jgi:histidyl-tRNA synthetase